MRVLTKDDILKGKEKRVTIYIKEYDANVVIRPLTDGEITEILEKANVKGASEDWKNMKVLRLAAAYGLVEPKLTEEEVAQMKFGVPEYIGMRVLEISGVVTREEAEKKE